MRSLQPPDILWIHWRVYNFIVNTTKRVLFLSPSDAYVRSFLYLLYTLIKLYYTKALSDQASSLALDWILLLWGPRIPMSSNDSTTPFQDCGSIPGLGRSPGGGNGNPLQYSCLENPIDWGKKEMSYQSAERLDAAAKLLQLCPTLCDPRDGSPPGSPVPGILQARTLEWVAISFSNAWQWKVKVKSLSRVQLLVTPWTAAYQAPPSMGFSRQEYWGGVPLPSLQKDLEET